MTKIVQFISTVVNTSNQRVVLDSDFHTFGKKLVGFAAKQDMCTPLNYMMVSVNGMEILPVMPVEMIQSDFTLIAPDEKFFTLIPDAGNIKGQKLKGYIQDAGVAQVYPYRFNFYLLLEI